MKDSTVPTVIVKHIKRERIRQVRHWGGDMVLHTEGPEKRGRATCHQTGSRLLEPNSRRIMVLQLSYPLRVRMCIIRHSHAGTYTHTTYEG
eukprot:13547-Eustigmatos_ZCMA.PRE.1